MTSIFKENEKYYLNDNDKIIEITELDPNNSNSLKLPENSSNRKFISMKKIDNAPNQILELSYKDKISYNNSISRPQSYPQSRDIDYLDDDEKEIFQSLIEKIEKRKKIERMKKEIEKYQRMLDEMGE